MILIASILLCTMKSPNVEYVSDLRGKIALFVGADTEIGILSVRELVRRGAYVIAVARYVSELNKSTREISGAVTFISLNQESLHEVINFANKFEQDFAGKPLDMLIFNSIGTISPYKKTRDGFESQIQTNYLSYFLLAKLFMSKIRQSGTHVLTIASLAHRFSYDNGIEFNHNEENFHPVKAYGQSELAKLLFSRELAVRLGGSNATSNAFHPGMISVINVYLI